MSSVTREAIFYSDRTGTMKEKKRKASAGKPILPDLTGKKRLPLYLAAVVSAALSVIQAAAQILIQPAGIAVYVLAALFLTAGCIYLVQDIRNGIVKRLLAAVKKYPFGKRFFEDYEFRTFFTTLPAVLINAAYTVYNGVLGIVSRSAWFITMAVYYSLLGIMRFHAVNTQKRTAQMTDPEEIRKKETAVLRTDGILLLLLNLALSGVVFLTIARDMAKQYSDVVVISIAAYTFYKIVMAVIHMVKARKMRSPLLITLRNIGAASALVSLLTLQTTMLASFASENSSLDANVMNAATGFAVCVLIAALGIHMIYTSRRKF